MRWRILDRTGSKSEEREMRSLRIASRMKTFVLDLFGRVTRSPSSKPMHRHLPWEASIGEYPSRPCNYFNRWRVLPRLLRRIKQGVVSTDSAHFQLRFASRAGLPSAPIGRRVNSLWSLRINGVGVAAIGSICVLKGAQSLKSVFLAWVQS